MRRAAARRRPRAPADGARACAGRGRPRGPSPRRHSRPTIPPGGPCRRAPRAPPSGRHRGCSAKRLPPTVATLRTAGPPTSRATGARTARSRWATIIGHRDPGADHDAVAARADVPEGRIGDAQDRVERLIAGVDRTHDDRAAGQQTRAAPTEGALGLVEACEAVDRDGHQICFQPGRLRVGYARARPRSRPDRCLPPQAPAAPPHAPWACRSATPRPRTSCRRR